MLPLTQKVNNRPRFIGRVAAVVGRQRGLKGAAVLRTRPSRMPPPSGAKLLGRPDPLASRLLQMDVNKVCRGYTWIVTRRLRVSGRQVGW